jgi:hypothetical protein
MTLQAALTLNLAGNKVAAMFPYKVVSKKGAKLTSGLITTNSSVFVPVSSNEEYNCVTQLAIMVEVLVQNRAKVIERIEGDLDDTTKPFGSEFPSIVRILKDNGLLHFFLKDFHAEVVDEYQELMLQIDSLRGWQDTLQDADRQIEEKLEEDLAMSEMQDSSASVSSTDNVPDYDREASEIVRRNQEFLGIKPRGDPAKTLDSEPHFSRRRKSKQLLKSSFKSWVEDSSDENAAIFDFEYVLLTKEELYSPSDKLLASLMPRTPQITTKLQNKIKEFSPSKKEPERSIEPPSLKPQPETPKIIKPVIRPDYFYYEYRIEKLVISEENSEETVRHEKLPTPAESSHKKSRDEHHEVEVSTRSEENQEECVDVNERTADEPVLVREEPKILSKAAKKKAKKHKKKDETNIPEGSRELEARGKKEEPNSPKEEIRDSAKLSKIKPGVGFKPIEPAFIEECQYLYEPFKEKLKQKEMDKLKQDTKDHLKEQLIKIPTVENLDEFEKECIVEINSLDSLTKKMKQKARRKLRQDIDTEKLKRNEKITQQQTEDFEDECEEQERRVLDFFINNGKHMNLNDKLLKRLCQEDPTQLLMHLNASGLNWTSLCSGKKLSSTLIKDPKVELKGKKKDFGGQKWKEKIQNTIEKLDCELSQYEEKFEQAEMIYNLYQQFKDSSIKPVLNILHENYHAIKENFVVSRSNKVGRGSSQETRIIFKLSEDTILNESFLK